MMLSVLQCHLKDDDKGHLIHDKRFLIKVYLRITTGNVNGICCLVYHIDGKFIYAGH